MAVTINRPGEPTLLPTELPSTPAATATAKDKDAVKVGKASASATRAVSPGVRDGVDAASRPGAKVSAAAAALVAAPNAEALANAELARLLADVLTPLAAQVGDVRAATATPAPQFSAEVKLATYAAPSTLFSAETRDALLDLRNAVDCGQVKLSPQMLAQLDQRVTLACLLPTPGASAPLQSSLTAAQQSALQQVVARLGPMVQRYVQSALREGGTRAAERMLARLAGHEDLGDFDLSSPGQDIHTLPASIQRILSPLDDIASSEDEKVSFEMGGRAQSADVPVGALDSEIVIPGPEIVQLEQSFKSSLFDGNIDIMTLANIVMSECSSDAAAELRDELKEMKKLNAQKKETRAFVAQMKKQKAEMQSNLRAEYDRRTALPAGDPARIAGGLPSFDDFCDSQKLMLADGDLNSVGARGVPEPEPRFALSPNSTNYPAPTTADESWEGYTITANDRFMAEQLHLDARQLMQLRRTWDSDPQLQLRFLGGMSEWLVRPQSEGGVGLALDAAGSQGSIAAEFLLAHDPAVVSQRIADAYDLPLDKVVELQSYYAERLSPSQRGASFEAWVASEEGPGLVAGAADNASKIGDFLRRVETNADIAGLATDYLLSPAQIRGLEAYWQTIPAEARPADLRTFLQTPPPNGPGLRMDSSDNETKFATWLEAELNYTSPVPAATAAAPTPSPYSYVSQGRTEEVDYVELLEMAGSAGDPGSVEHGQVLAMIEQALARITPASVGSAVRVQVRAYMTGLMASNNGGSSRTRTLSGLLSALSSIPGITPQGLSEAKQYACSVWAVCGAELRFAGSNGVNVLDNATWMQANVMVDGGGDCDGSHDENWVHRCGNSFNASVYANVAGDIAIQVDADAYPPDSDDEDSEDGASVRFATDAAQRNSLRSAALLILNHGYDPLPEPATPHAPAQPSPAGAPDTPLTAAEAAELAMLRAQLASNVQNGYDLGLEWNGIPQDRYWELNNRWAAHGVAEGAGASGADELSDLTDAQRAAMAALDGGAAAGVGQPPRVEGLTEMTLADLDAVIEEWQGKSDTLGDMSAERQMRISMFQERYTKFTQTLSNMMKKAADTQNAIIGNMR